MDAGEALATTARTPRCSADSAACSRECPGRSCGRRRRTRRPTASARVVELRVEAAEHEVARRPGCSPRRAMPSAPSGAMSPVEMSSPTTISTRPVDRLRRRLGTRGGGDDVVAPRHLDRAPPPRAERRQDLAVVDARVAGGGASVPRLGRAPRGSVICAGSARGRRGRRRAEVDRVVRGAAAAGEVAVERAQRAAPGGRRLAHADAGPADRLQHARARPRQLAVHAARARSCRGSAASPASRSARVRVHDRVAQHGGDDRQVLVRGVHRAAHADLRRRRCPRPPPPGRRRPARTAARSAARARRGRSARPRRRRRRRRRRAARTASSRSWRASHSRVALVAREQARRSRRSPRPCCRSSPRSVTDSVATPWPWNSNTQPTPPRTPRRRSSSRITSFACTTAAARPSAPLRRQSAAAARTAAPARPPRPPARRRRPRASRAAPAVVVWRVGADHHAPGPREALQVHVVADAVPGARVVEPVARCRTPAGRGGPALFFSSIWRTLWST